MNDRARQGVLGAPSRQHPVPPAWPARRPAPLGLRSGARPASALNLEELRRKARAGDSDGSGDRGSAIVPFLAPGALRLAQRCRRGTPGWNWPPTAGSPSLSFSRRSFGKGREEGCSSSDGLRAAGASGGGRIWSGERDACLHRPRPLPRSVGALPNPPSLRYRRGQVCVRYLVFAVCRVHLPSPGSRSPLRLDLAPLFCGVCVEVEGKLRLWRGSRRGR